MDAQDPLTGTIRHVNSAYLVFVAVVGRAGPREVPRLLAETDIERRRQQEAKLRRERRTAHREAIGRRGRPRASAGPEPSPGTHATRGVWM